MTAPFSLNEVIRCVTLRLHADREAAHLLSKRHIFPGKRTSREYRLLRRNNKTCIDRCLSRLRQMQNPNIDTIINVVRVEFLPQNAPPPLVRKCTGWFGISLHVESKCTIQTHEK